MPRPWTLLERVETKEGPLELRKRGERDFMISIDGRVLMSSNIHGSEVAVAQHGLLKVQHRERARVLIGGLGLGFTLRAALDVLPKGAAVTVAELNPVVVRWCRGPAAEITDGAALDPRVRIVEGDVAKEIRSVANDPKRPRYDAIVLDLYIGPGDSSHGSTEGLYGADILRRTHQALSPGGTYAVWGEDAAPAFEKRLKRTGFATEFVLSRGGGPRHAIYVATK